MWAGVMGLLGVSLPVKCPPADMALIVVCLLTGADFACWNNHFYLIGGMACPIPDACVVQLHALFHLVPNPPHLLLPVEAEPDPNLALPTLITIFSGSLRPC